MLMLMPSAIATPQVARPLQRGLRVIRQVGLDLDGYEAIGPVRRVVHRPQHVGRIANIADRDFLVDVAAVSARFDLAPDELVVLAAGDRLAEDGRVAGQAPDSVLHHLRQPA
jgi:hypothetical protein